MPVTRAMRKKADETNTKENEPVEKDIKETKIQKKEKAKEAKPQEPTKTAVKRKPGPASHTGRQVYNPAMSITMTSHTPRATPSKPLPKSVIQDSPGTFASPKKKKTKGNVKSKPVISIPDEPEVSREQPEAEVLSRYPPRNKAKPDKYLPSKYNKKRPAQAKREQSMTRDSVRSILVTTAGSDSSEMRNLRTRDPTPPRALKAVKKTRTPRKPRNKTSLPPESPVEVVDIAEDSPVEVDRCIANDRPKRNLFKRNSIGISAAVSVKTSRKARRSSGFVIKKPRAEAKPATKAVTRKPTRDDEQVEQDRRQLRNVVKKLGPGGSWETRILQITLKTTTALSESMNYIKTAVDQTKKNWTQNKQDPRRAIQQTPLIRNLRSRKVAHETSTREAEDVTAKKATGKKNKVFKFAPAKDIVTGAKKRVRSPDVDSPRGLRHELPKNFDFSSHLEQKRSQQAKRLAFDGSSLVSEAVQAFETLTLKAQEKPQIMPSSPRKWTPKKSEVESTPGFKIPTQPVPKSVQKQKPAPVHLNVPLPSLPPPPIVELSSLEQNSGTRIVLEPEKPKDMQAQQSSEPLVSETQQSGKPRLSQGQQSTEPLASQAQQLGKPLVSKAHDSKEPLVSQSQHSEEAQNVRPSNKTPPTSARSEDSTFYSCVEYTPIPSVIEEEPEEDEVPAKEGSANVSTEMIFDGPEDAESTFSMDISVCHNGADPEDKLNLNMTVDMEDLSEASFDKIEELTFDKEPEPCQEGVLSEVISGPNETFNVESIPASKIQSGTDATFNVIPGPETTFSVAGANATFSVNSGAYATFNVEQKQKREEIPKCQETGPSRDNPNATFNITKQPEIIEKPSICGVLRKLFPSSKPTPIIEYPLIDPPTSGKANHNATFDVKPGQAPKKVPISDHTFVVPAPKKPLKVTTHERDDSDEDDSFLSCRNETLNSPDRARRETGNFPNLTEMVAAAEKGYPFDWKTGTTKTYKEKEKVQTRTESLETELAFPISSIGVGSSYLEKHGDENAENEFPLSEDMSICEGNIDTYDITLYEDLDEENGHRAEKVLPAWAANKQYLMEQLYSLSPAFTGAAVDACVFPGMPKFKLFPGAMPPRRAP